MQVPVKEKMINSAIKWVGGKSRFRKQIISIIHPHSCYVELFGGGAWVLFGKDPSDVEVLNDIDQELTNFFRVVKHRPEELISAFELELVSRAEFDRLADLDPTTLNDIQRAHRFYYLIMAGWGGELNYPRFATSISDGGHGNRLIGALKYLRQRIDPVYNRLKKVLIENLSWEECFERYNREQTFMYIDPPYPDNKCNYAHNMRSWDEHTALSEKLREANCKWALSSYDNEEVRKLYAGFNIIPLQAYSGMRVKKNDTKRVMNLEVLITNYNVSQTEQALILPFED